MKTVYRRKNMIAFLLTAVMLFMSVFANASLSALAAGIFGSDASSVKLISSENGSLAFTDKSGSKALFAEGDTVTVKVDPVDGYGADISVQTEDGYLDFDYDDSTQMLSFVKPGKAVVVMADFAWGRTTNLNKVKEGNVELSFDYLLKNLNEEYVDPENVEKVEAKDAILVKHTMADGRKLKGEQTIDALWAELESGTDKDIAADDIAFIGQSQAVMLLYDVDAKSDYYVAHINTMAKDDASSVTDWAFAYTNNNGEVIDDCIYDENTGLAYVPKKYLEENKNGEGILNVQAQLLHVFDSEEVTSKVNVVVDAENVKGEVAGTGVITADTMVDEIYIQLAENDAAKKDIEKDDIRVYVNGAESAFAYSAESGVLGVPANAGAVDSISVSVNKEADTFANNVEEVAMDTARKLGFVAEAATISDDGSVGFAGQTLKVEGGTPQVGDTYTIGSSESGYQYYGQNTPNGNTTILNAGTPVFKDASCKAAYEASKSRFAEGQDMNLRVNNGIDITNGNSIVYVQDNSNSLFDKIANETLALSGSSTITKQVNNMNWVAVIYSSPARTYTAGTRKYTYDGWYNNSGLNSLLRGTQYEGLTTDQLKESYAIPLTCAHDTRGINTTSQNNLVAKVLYVNTTEKTLYVSYMTQTLNTQAGVGIVKYKYVPSNPTTYKVSVKKSTSGGISFDKSGINFDVYVENTKVGNIAVDSNGYPTSVTGLANGFTKTPDTTGSLHGGYYIAWESYAETQSVKLVENLGTNIYHQNTSSTLTTTLSANGTKTFTFDVANPYNPVSVQIRKQSENCDITDGNVNYAHNGAGAKFRVYLSNADAVNNTNHIAELTAYMERDGYMYTPSFEVTDWIKEYKTFYVKETEAPLGYKIDNTVKSVRFTDADIKARATKVVTYSDVPEADPFDIIITKSNASGGAEVKSLEGAIFEISYYDEIVDSKDELAGLTPTRTWYFKTINLLGKYVINNDISECYISDEFTVDGTKYLSDPLYLENEVAVLPYGSVTIKEIKAADGYVLDSGDVKVSDKNGNLIDCSDRVAFFTVTNNNDMLYMKVNNDIETNGEISVTNKEIRGDFSLNKVDIDGRPLDGVEFKLSLVDGDKVIESHIIKTDENGHYDSATDDNLWFYGTTETEGLVKTEGEGKLISGDYVLTELKTEKTKKFQIVDGIYFTVDTDGENKDLGTIINVEQPGIGTLEWDSETENHMSFADGTVTVKDTVSFYRLRENEDYTMKGILMEILEDGSVVPFTDADGNIVVSHESFNSGDSKDSSVFNTSGTVDVTYTFNADNLEGKRFVIYEYLYDGNDDTDVSVENDVVVTGNVKKNDNGDVIVHTDKDDESQIGYLPKVRTSAKDFNTNEHVAYADLLTIADDVMYSYITAGLEYKIIGTVIDTETGEPVEKDGEIYEVTKEFTAENASGTETITFSFDATDCEGKTYVVFEELYVKKGNDYVKIAEHKDMDDDNQTIVIPKIGTTALDDDTNDHIALADAGTTFTDTVSYENLWTGIEYTLKGYIYVKESGEPLYDKDGEPVMAEYTFTPDTADGSAELTFSLENVDFEELAGNSIVVFERLYYNGELVGRHEDIDDEDQTIRFPGVKTDLVNDETGIKNATVNEEMSFTDTVSLTNLLPGRSYKVSGILMNRVTGEPLTIGGEPITSEYEFDADEFIDADSDEEVLSVSGIVNITFTFNGTLIENLVDEDGVAAPIVCFEKLYVIYNGEEETEEGIVEVTEEKLVGSHEDLNDDFQTVTIPHGRTTALDAESQSHTAMPDEEVEIVDTVYYYGLIPGKEYTMTGTLMIVKDKEAEECVVNGEVITETVTFTPEEADGTVDVIFKFDGSKLKGEKTVVFEECDYEGVKIFAHADIEDEDQTIRFPELKTKAADVNGNKTVENESVLTIIDTITYKNLTVGETYTAKAVLMNPATKSEFIIDGKPITGETTFTPVSENGEVKVQLEFPAEKILKGGESLEAVVFETIYSANGTIIGEHKDFDDLDQTVSLYRPSTQTGDDSMLPIATAVATASLAGAAVLIRKRKEDKE